MKRQKGFSLLGILLAIAIVILLYYAAMKVYFRGPVVDKKTQQSLAEQGIDSTDYKKMIDTAKNKLGEIEKKMKKREKQLRKIK